MLLSVRLLTLSVPTCVGISRTSSGSRRVNLGSQSVARAVVSCSATSRVLARDAAAAEGREGALVEVEEAVLAVVRLARAPSLYMSGRLEVSSGDILSRMSFLWAAVSEQGDRQEAGLLIGVGSGYLAH